jgi:hypothetical protein
MKNLPIKVFEKRKIIDDRNPEGGGNNELPPWAELSTDELNQRVNSFNTVLTDAVAWLDQRPKDRDFIPAVLRLNIDDRAIAKSHRPDIGRIFNDSEQQSVIGMINNRDLLVKINGVDQIRSIQKNLEKTKKYQKGIAAITEMTQYSPDVILDEDWLQQSLRVSLINYQNYHLNNSVCEVFETACRMQGISFKKVNYTPDLIIYRIADVTLDAIEDLKTFEALETLYVMPRFTITFDSIPNGDSVDIPIKYPEEGKSYPTVGILDSGITPIPHLKPWLLPERFSKVPQDRKDESHGTFVAGIVVYGDELEKVHPNGVGGCYIFDAAIIPDPLKDTIEESDLIEHVREAISKHKNIKTWNLSLGSSQEADMNTFSPFGMALDQIQSENGVIICKSAGNCTNFVRNHPVSRISRSADSVLSLVIGAIAHSKGQYDQAEVFHPSPFSRIGSGPSYINKPELTHIGGNAGVDPANNKMVITGVHSFSKNGHITTNVGTSFSTPRVASLVSGINHSLKEDFNPLLIKALTVHSAKYPAPLSIPTKERLAMLGYGVPASLDNILYNDPYEITLILQDGLTKGSWIQMLDFPYPDALVDDNGKYYGEIIATLVTQPMFAENQGGEYCQSNIAFRFGTHNGVRKRDNKQNPVYHSDGKNLLHPSLYSANAISDTEGQFAHERTLVQYGEKFHPIKKYAINLEEMTPANADRYLTAPKHWYLEVKGIFRDYISGRSVSDGIVLNQNYCLIITIRDNKRKHKVYNLTTNLLTSRGFIHSNINLSADVRVRV